MNGLGTYIYLKIETVHCDSMTMVGQPLAAGQLQFATSLLISAAYLIQDIILCTRVLRASILNDLNIIFLEDFNFTDKYRIRMS